MFLRDEKNFAKRFSIQENCWNSQWNNSTVFNNEQLCSILLKLLMLICYVTATLGHLKLLRSQARFDILAILKYLEIKVTSHFTMCRGTSRCGASHHMLFFQFTLVKRCLIFLVTMASQQQDMLLALALQTQVIALIVLQKQRKSDDFRF